MKLKITLTKSTNGRLEAQKRTVASLGLRKIGQSVVQPDNPATRGKIFRVQHMVCVEQIQE